MRNVRWRLLSTAAIGETVVRATKSSTMTQFVAVASRDGMRASDFADRAGLARSFDSYEAMLDSDEVEAVYIALPVSMHTEWTVKALHAGKHVLCEKPFATIAADAEQCFEVAESSGRLCVEGLMYRHHPWTKLVRRLVADGAIGELAYVRSALSVAVESDDIRRIRSLGGDRCSTWGVTA